jgi:hypothetical protein
MTGLVVFMDILDLGNVPSSSEVVYPSYVVVVALLDTEYKGAVGFDGAEAKTLAKAAVGNNDGKWFAW